MAAYAVIARIERVEPHVRAHGHDLDPGLGEGLAGPTTDVDVEIEIIQASEPGPIAERLVRLQELWRQTTFFLFDAESWRT